MQKEYGGHSLLGAHPERLRQGEEIRGSFKITKVRRTESVVLKKFFLAI